jgi:hypothetical protein
LISTGSKPDFFLSDTLRRSNCTALAVLGVVVGLPGVAVADRERAIAGDGTVLTGRLIGDAPESIVWRSPGQADRRLIDLRRIEFPAATVVGPAGPPRQIVLRGGERVAGVLVGLDAQAATFLFGGGGQVTVPRDLLSSVSRIGRWRDVLYEDFDRGTVSFGSAGDRAGAELVREEAGTRVLHVGPGTRLTQTFESPIETGRVELRFRCGNRPAGGSAGGIEFVFTADTDQNILRVTLGGADGPAVESPAGASLAIQRLRPRGGWQRLVVQFREGRVQVLIDEHLLASGSLAGKLSEIRLSGGNTEFATGTLPRETAEGTRETAELLIDDIVVQQDVDAGERASTQPSGADMVELDSGDRLFGTITRADGHQVEVEGVFGTVNRSWSDVVRIALHHDQPPPVRQPIAGCWARVVLQPPLESDEPDELALELAIQAVRDEHIIARHAILGDVRLPLAGVRRIEPQFVGLRLPLSRDVHHLGDEVRAGFRQPTPTGPTLAGEFVLESAPRDSAVFVVEVADLEPSGPDTPLGSPFLRELRSGHLVTELFVNEQRIARLNDALRWRASPGDPQRIRMAIPGGVLRAGSNLWKLEQQPARDDPGEFDDAEVGPIAIEFERH